MKILVRYDCCFSLSLFLYFETQCVGGVYEMSDRAVELKFYGNIRDHFKSLQVR